MKKGEMLPFRTICMELEDIMRNESEKDKYHMISLTCGIYIFKNLK